MIRICLRTAEGVLAESAGLDEAWLCADRVYQPGDVIEITGPRHLRLQMDQAMPSGEVYLPNGRMTWNPPAGEHRLAYAPGTFEAPRHVIIARALTDAEVTACRDLALNPADLRGDTDFYPHCTANVETRNEACFCARNVIDGIRCNTFHGEWPYQSWGIGARADAWCRLEFGREVRLERMALTLRADFPHDAYWVAGHVVFSDGMEKAFALEKTGERQWVELDGRAARWLRLERLEKSDDPSAFPALRAWEVFGCDTENGSLR
ncbi:MAG: carbohydrate-binding protein [Clostridia bacterium]|nr:carbohydrate-binding protein [Clostridia bacterium]